jgi:alpha-ribazole phosphatase
MSTSSVSVFNLLRHGQVTGPAALNGKTNMALSKQGWKNMQTQLMHSVVPDNIITSPLIRCSAFADNLAQQLNLPVQIANDLQECDFGDYDGIPFDDLSAQWLQLNAFWKSPYTNTLPRGEPLQAFHSRVSRVWQRLLNQHKGQNNLIICHGGVIRQILAQVLPVDWKNGDWYSQLNIGYASLTRITVAEHPQAKPRVEFIARPAFDGSTNS